MGDLSTAAKQSKDRVARMICGQAEEVAVTVEVEPWVPGLSIVDERVQIRVTLPFDGYGFTVTVVRYATGGVDISSGFAFNPGAVRTAKGSDLHTLTLGLAHQLVVLSGLELGLSEADRALIQQHEDSRGSRLRRSFDAYKKSKEGYGTDE